jgi:hypothetical protein
MEPKEQGKGSLVAAAIGALVIAITLGVAVGTITAIGSRPPAGAPPAKAAFYAAAVSESMNCSAAFSIFGIPAAVLIAWLRRRRST